jgi:hypothetical protein
MSDADGDAGNRDSGSDSGGRPTKVEDRVKRRVKLLEKWTAEGVPQDRLRTLPTSLRDAREWDDIELGIEPISSPNEFTTTHPGWGSSVAKIGALLRGLHARNRPPQRKKSSRQEATDSRGEVDRLTILLQRVTSQWHSARQAATKAAADAEYHEAVSEDLKGQLARKEEDLANVRRAMHTLEAVPRLPRP